MDVLANKDEMRRMLGYLPQDFGLYPKVRAIDLLDHLAVLKGLSNRSERNETVEALLNQVNLWDARNQKLGTFSGGMAFEEIGAQIDPELDKSYGLRCSEEPPS